jgi:hypothetical protein
MAIDPARAKSLFLSASDLNRDDRAAYLERACSGDAELRQRVEALLRANDAAPLPPAGAAIVDSAEGQSGTRDYGDPTARVGAILAGKYKLVEQIGAGGMGSVFMAQQTAPVKRVVLYAGKRDLALPLLERMLERRRAKLGPDHPDTLQSKKNLDFVRALLSAETRYRARLADVGPKHIDTLLARRDMAQMYLTTNRLDEAEALLCEVMQGMTDRAADDAVVVFTTGLLARCLAARQRADAGAWTTFHTQSLLGGALLGQKKYAAAEPLLLKGYEGMKSRAKTIPQQGGGKLRIPDILDRLIELYTATNQPDEVKKWQAERAMYPQRKSEH